jgi:hypothetical protein
MDRIMRRHWLVIAAAVGFFSAALVWQWPASPMWQRTGAIDGQVLRFGPDDRTLYTAEGLSMDANNSGRVTGSSAVRRTPRLCKWDAATGELLGAVSISCTSVMPLGFLSPDARVLLICQPEPATNNAPWTWLLFDAETGQQRGAPLGDDVIYPYTRNFSHDSRWLWLRHGSRSKGLGLDIIATATAKRVVRVRDNEDEIPVTCCISPDGSAAAIE